MRAFRKDSSGATAVEFALIFVPLLLVTFGIIEFGYALFQWNSAEKATRMGARIAIARDAVAPELITFDCGNGTLLPAGTPCSDPGAVTFGSGGSGIITCTCSGTGTCSSASCTNAGGADKEAFDLILQQMRRIYPRIEAGNVVVEYQDLQLGFSGLGGARAAVSVYLQNMTYEFFVLDVLVPGLGDMGMPDFRQTLTSEDLSSAGTG